MSDAEFLARRRSRLHQAFRSRLPVIYRDCLERARGICGANKLPPSTAVQVIDAVVAMTAVGMEVES